jgi:hypothetical protein
MKIIETEDNLLKISDETFGGWWVGYQANQGQGYDLGIDYTFNPISQVTANPYRFEAVVRNQGALDQHNVILNVDVQNGGASVFSTTSTPITLNVMDSDTLITNTLSPQSFGYHQINFWASSDSISTTDTISRGTIVTDTVYAIDFDWDSDGANAGSGEKLGRSCGGQVLGNAFDIYADDTATSISFHVNEESVAGAELIVELYEIDPFTTPYSPVYIGESDSYTLTQNDINSWVTISLSDPIKVYASTTYIAAVKGFVNPIDTSVISRTSKHNTLSFIQDNGCDIGSGGFGYWYSTSTRAFMIRLNLGSVHQVTSIDENIFSGKLTLSPNPTNGIISIDMMDVDASNYEITITNILGKEILHINENVSGIYNNKLDLSSFAKGTYIIQIANKNKVFTDKIIIK